MAKLTIEQSMAENGFHLATVKGDSMMPLLREGKDLVKVVPVSERLKVNDIALFKRPTGEYVLHRVVKVKNNCYVICGDNRFLREDIPFDWIVGKAESVFIDDEEIKMDSERQQKYADKIRKTYWARRIKRKLS